MKKQIKERLEELKAEYESGQKMLADCKFFQRIIPMKKQIKERLEELKAEYESGQKMLADLEAQGSNIRTTMLRISGAIQVLE